MVWDRANEPRASFDARVIDAVARTEPQLVLLLGWMHLLPPAFLRRFPETINLHPSFLPLDPAADDVVAPDGTVIPALRGAHALRDAVRDRAPGWVPPCTTLPRRPTAERCWCASPSPWVTPTDEAALRERIRPVEFDAVAAAIRRWTFER